MATILALNNPSSTQIDPIKLPLGLKRVGECLNRTRFAYPCSNIKMCYGLELTAAAIESGDLQKTKKLMNAVRATLVRDIGCSDVVCAGELDRAIKSRLDDGAQTDPMFAQVQGQPATLLEVMKAFNKEHIRKTMKGDINLINALSALHNAFYELASLEKNRVDFSKDSKISLKAALSKSYKALKPSMLDDADDAIFKEMVKLAS